MLRTIFFSIFTQIAVGLVFTVLLISKEEIGKLYFRVSTGVALILMLLGMFVRPFGPESLRQMLAVHHSALETMQALIYTAFGMSVFLLLAYNFVYPRAHKLLLFLTWLAGLSGVGLHAWILASPFQEHLAGKILFVLSGFSSAFILGTVLGAMITGHWYLVKSKLTLRPLIVSSRVFIFSVLFKMLILVLTFFTFQAPEGGVNLLAWLTSLAPDSLFLLGRLFIGIVLPLIFGVMVWKTVKIRSTQSATGILYATIILVIIGEAFAKFLSNVTGIPL
ncbi:MAG: hypothetical protein ACE5HO_19855 [bacterium]